jgi:hypothetical protein
VLEADPPHAEIDHEERLEGDANEPVEEEVDPGLTGALVQSLSLCVIHDMSRTRGGPGRYSQATVSSAANRTRTLRGALSGALAAAVWGLQQPLDKKLFASRFDDVELLGRAVTRGDGWYPVGFAIHMTNGAAFGAAYANVAPSLPLPPALRGPAAAMAENVASWPLVALADRFHPARDELPRLLGNRRALAQATWRHLLFGALLGELERRVNHEPEPPEPEPEAPFSSNGHGSLEHALSGQPDD